MKKIRLTRWLGGLMTAGLACGVLLLAGCGDDDKTTAPPEVLAPPTNLRAVNGHEQVTVRWSPSPDAALSDFRRYNIYRGTAPLLSIDAYQLEQLGNKVGSVAAGVDTFRTTVANGTLYYFHVRAEKTSGLLSGPTNEVQAAGRAEGSGRVLEEFASDGDSGFDFSSGLTVSLDQDNPDRFVLTDVYLGTGAADDDPSAVLSIKSPELLARLNGEWASRQASVKFLGTDWEASTTASTGFSTQLDVLSGAVYAIKTPGNTYAKIKVESIDGSAGSRSITFRFAHQSTPNLIQF